MLMINMSTSYLQVLTVLPLITVVAGYTEINLSKGNDFNIIARYGDIISSPVMNCTISTKGNILSNYTTTHINTSGLKVYGLIKYTCGEHQGTLISKAECNPCYFYCLENQYLLDCKHRVLPIVLGSIIGITASAIFLIIIIKIVSPKVRKAIQQREYNKSNRFSDKVIIAMESVNANRSPQRVNKAKLGLLTLVASCPDLSNACDRTLFFSNQGSVCENGICSELSMYSFSMLTGSTICFDGARGRLTVQADNFYILDDFSYLYDTSDFTIRTEDYSRCKGTDECVTNTCRKNTRHELFGNVTNNDIFGCNHEGLGCNFGCWHKYACTWYHAWIELKGTPAQVYSFTGRTWSTDINISYNNIKTSNTLTTNNPTNTIYLDRITNEGIEIPITISSVVTEFKPINKFLTKHSERYYHIDANEKHYPMIHKVGDIQIDHFGNIKYPNMMIECTTSSCNTSCEASEPAIVTLQKIRPSKNEFLDKSYSVLERVKSNAMITINLGNLNLNNLYIDKAECNINIIYSTGCIGCNDKPSVIYLPTQLVKPGLMPIKSNCTFTTQYIVCDNMYNELFLTEHQKDCYIYTEVNNNTYHVHIDYQLDSNLTSYSNVISYPTGFKANMKHILTSEDFINSITYSILGVSVLTLLAGFLTKIITRLIMCYSVEHSTIK